MRILIALHGYPPELTGGTELAAQALARAVAGRGHQVTVVAGSLEARGAFHLSEGLDTDPESGATLAVRRVHRSDLYFDHWHKGGSVSVQRAFRDLVRRLRPDVVHVMHWLRLSDDLVLTAAREGIPATVFLPDSHVSCLLTLRVHPGELAPCTRPYSAMGCVRCAAAVPPRTPWVPLDQQVLTFAQRASALGRELRLARARLVPSRAHGEALVRHLGEDSLGFEVVPPPRPRTLARRTPRAAPGVGERLVLGSWGHTSRAKGAALLVQALSAPDLAPRLELRLAGPAAGPPDPDDPPDPDGLRQRSFPAYGLAELGRHPVTDVHGAVVASLAPESYGIVADEALELGLPMVLPRAGALPTRFDEGQGVLFYGPGDAADLARAVRSLLTEPGRLAVLGASLPRPTAPRIVSRAAIVDHHLELWERVVAGGPPDPDQVGRSEWFEQPMREKATAAWDAACAATPASDLGLGDRGVKEGPP